jgi:DNA-binding beta-propeller fold protein YncE
MVARAAAVISLSALFGISACDREFTLSYVYAPSASLSSGLINAYGIDNQTGNLNLLADSPIPSGGRKPNAIVAAPNRLALYVTNHDDSNVVQFAIGTDGKLYPTNTYNTTGSFPTGVAISADGKFLYIPYTYQMGFTTASPGPGGISIFQVASDNSLGSSTSPAVDFPIGRAPVAIATSTKQTSGGQNIVYVLAQDAAAVNPAASIPSDQTLNLFAFAADPATGALTPLPGETIVAGNKPSFGYATGLAPAGLLEDASGTHLYVTDASGNILIAYAISANGVPTLIAGGTAPTGKQPGGLAIDPTGQYLYVANYEGSLSGYTFGSGGVPVTSTVAATTQAGTGTTCVTIEPTLGKYLYASGSLSNTIIGEQIIPADGSLKPIINSPYAASTLPTCTVSVARP